jgi:hypothetical protein
MNSPFSMLRLKSLTTRFGPKDFSRCSDLKKGHQRPLPFLCVLRKAGDQLDQPMQPQVMAKAITASAAGS